MWSLFYFFELAEMLILILHIMSFKCKMHLILISYIMVAIHLLYFSICNVAKYTLSFYHIYIIWGFYFNLTFVCKKWGFCQHNKNVNSCRREAFWVKSTEMEHQKFFRNHKIDESTLKYYSVDLEWLNQVIRIYSNVKFLEII